MTCGYYRTSSPVTALPMIMRWISLVPSNMVKILEVQGSFRRSATPSWYQQGPSMPRPGWTHTGPDDMGMSLLQRAT